MRPPKTIDVYQYEDNETTLVTTDKKLAVLVYEHAKKKGVRELDEKISEIKEKIEEEN